ncbi:MAG: hypothetical protein AB1505_01705 [Candidatus Latescibacterota bacterium]
MFDDARSRKVVLAVHCVLNQSARIDGCAYFPGVMGGVAQLLVDSGVGIVQLPCPELLYLGLDRQEHGGREIGIREALSTPGGREACAAMVAPIVRQVEEYQRHGFTVLGLIGNDGSPACGVARTYRHGAGPGPGEGAFIRALREALEASGIRLPVVAVADHEWSARAEAIRQLLAAAA